MKLFKIDPLGNVSEFETKAGPEQLLDDLKILLNSWPEVVSLPVVFEGTRVQLIAILNEVGAIDGRTLPNTLATQFYRYNGELANMGGRPQFLWGDVYFATLDYNDPDAYPQELPASYGIAEFVDILKRLILCKERFLMV